jgi:hypothetical protein
MHWPSNEVFNAAVLPAWGPGSLYKYLVDLMGVTVSSDYYVSGIFPDYDVNGCGDYCGTGTSYVMFRSPSAGYTNSYSVYSFAMSGPCTGGGWNQGSCDYPLAGAGHRVDSAICARGDYCGASHAGVGKTPFMFSVDSNVFIRHIITGSLY